MQAPQEHFPELHYFSVQEVVLHRVLLSSHLLLSRVTLFQKGSILGNKDLAFGSKVEGIPNSFLRVSYEDALLRFGLELIRLKLFHISIATSNFKKRQLRFLAKPQFIRCRLNGF